MLISSAPPKLGLRVETVTGDVIEEHAVPYPSIEHEILSTHDIITQTDLRNGVPFEAVDLRNGHILLKGEDPAPHSPYGAAGNIRFATNADRSVVAVGYGPPHSDQPVTFYDMRTWRTLTTVTLRSPPAKFGSLWLSDDGKRLAYNADDAVIVVDVATGTVVQRLLVPTTRSLAFSPDGEMVAVAEHGPGGTDRREHRVAAAMRVFRLSDWAETARQGQLETAFVIVAGWDPCGRLLAYQDSSGRALHL